MSYQGCYKDDVQSRDLVHLVTLTDDNSPQRCRNECSSFGYPYIGLQVVITTAHCPYIIDTTRIVCGKLICNGRVSVRPSVCLSRRSTAAATCSWFAAYRLSIDVCGRQSLGCGQRQCRDPRRIDAELFRARLRSTGVF